MGKMKLSKNLSLGEYIKSNTADRRGIDNMIPNHLIPSAVALAENIFQPLRDHFGTPIYLSSGFRSDALNEAIGGSKKSQHSKAEAMDIDMDHRKGPENEDIFYYIMHNLDFDQIIWEFGTEDRPNWVHVSYNPEGIQRGQILIAYKDNGKTKYKLWDR